MTVIEQTLMIFLQHKAISFSERLLRGEMLLHAIEIYVVAITLNTGGNLNFCVEHT